MNTKQILGIAGSMILFVGVFAPIMSVPIIGNINYFQNGRGDGVIVLALAAISLILVLTKKYKGLWLTGLGSIGALSFTFINFQMKMSQTKDFMESQLAGDPFRGLADMAMQSIQLQWGWAVLMVGAALVIASAAIKGDQHEVITSGGGKALTRGQTYAAIIIAAVAIIIIFIFISKNYLNLSQSSKKVSSISEPKPAPVEPPLQFPPQQKYKHNFKITTKYEKIKDYTSVDLDGLPLGNKLDLSVYFVCSGKNILTPDNVTLFFHSSSDNWRYLTYHPLTLLLNDKDRMGFDEPKYDNNVGMGYVSEFMHFKVPIRSFLNIANANSVEGSLGTTEFKIKSPQLEAIRDLASRMQSQPKISSQNEAVGEKARDGRFIAYNNGTVLDTKTNLMWAAKDNGNEIKWANAKSYCESYRGGGYSDWRMPTQDELAGLYDAGKTYESDCGGIHLTDLIRLTCSFAWASETRASEAASFRFVEGSRHWLPQSTGNFDLFSRALPVRSGK